MMATASSAALPPLTATASPLYLALGANSVTLALSIASGPPVTLNNGDTVWTNFPTGWSLAAAPGSNWAIQGSSIVWQGTAALPIGTTSVSIPLTVSPPGSFSESVMVVQVQLRFGEVRLSAMSPVPFSLVQSEPVVAFASGGAVALLSESYQNTLECMIMPLQAAAPQKQATLTLTFHGLSEDGSSIDVTQYVKSDTLTVDAADLTFSPASDGQSWTAEVPSEWGAKANVGQEVVISGLLLNAPAGLGIFLIEARFIFNGVFGGTSAACQASAWFVAQGPYTIGVALDSSVPGYSGVCQQTSSGWEAVVFGESSLPGVLPLNCIVYDPGNQPCWMPVPAVVALTPNLKPDTSTSDLVYQPGPALNTVYLIATGSASSNDTPPATTSLADVITSCQVTAYAINPQTATPFDFAGMGITTLKGMKFPGWANLQGANFTNIDLSDADFSNVDLTGAILTGATLNGANLTGATITGVTSGGIVGWPSGFPASSSVFNGYLIGPGADLQGAQLVGLGLFDLRKDVDLSGANLSGAQLQNTQLSGDTFPKTFSNVILTGADLSGANLSYATLSNTILNKADLTNANLTGSTLTGATLTRATLTGATLTGVNLTGATITGVVSGGIVGTASAFPASSSVYGGYLIGPGVDLTDADLTNVDLTGATLTNATLAGANLTGTTITGVTSGGIVGWPSGFPASSSVFNGYLIGPGANLQGAQLVGLGLFDLRKDVDLSGANLGGAQLQNTQLSALGFPKTFSNVIFAGADLSGANLSYATLSNTILNNADLTNANLTGSDLSSCYIMGATFTVQTGAGGVTWPAGWSNQSGTLVYTPVQCQFPLIHMFFDGISITLNGVNGLAFGVTVEGPFEWILPAGAAYFGASGDCYLVLDTATGLSLVQAPAGLGAPANCLWGPTGPGAATFSALSDGNAVVQSQDGQTLWQANSGGMTATYLVILNNGTVAMCNGTVSVTGQSDLQVVYTIYSPPGSAS